MQKLVNGRRTGPEPEVAEKLTRSRQAAEGLPLRTIRCPNCGFYLLNVYGTGHYLLEIKCNKCKFHQTIDTALFRTMRPRRQQRFRAGQRRRYGQDLYLY